MSVNIDGWAGDLVELGAGRNISPYAFSPLAVTETAIDRFRMIAHASAAIEIR